METEVETEAAEGTAAEVRRSAVAVVVHVGGRVDWIEAAGRSGVREASTKVAMAGAGAEALAGAGGKAKGVVQMAVAAAAAAAAAGGVVVRVACRLRPSHMFMTLTAPRTGRCYRRSGRGK